MDIRAGRDRRRTWHVAAVGVLAAGLLAGVGGVEARQVPRAVSTEPLATVTVSPYRILDTRSGIGAPVGALGAEASIDVQIAGVGPVPANAVGVVLNLTSNQASAAGYVTAWPTGEERPTASVLNVTPGIDLPNMVTLALGTGGKVSLYNFTGSVHLIADVAAYLIPGGGGIGPQGPPGPPGPAGPSGPTHHTLVVAGAGWTPNTSVSIVHRAYGCTPLTTDLLLLDLPLPGGAVITKVSVAYGDAATNNGVRVTLQIAGVSTYLDGGSTSSSVMGTLPTTLATMSFTPPSPLPGASLESASPVLWAMPAAAGAPNGAVEVCGVEVAYTLPPT